MHILKTRATDAGKLERWLGKANVEHVSSLMKGWYGPPIPLAGAPGKVYAYPGGDFRGPLLHGGFASALDIAEGMARRFRYGLRQAARNAHSQLGMGFSSASDLISEATVGGKRREFLFNKVGPTGVANVTSSLWRVGPQPPAGAAPAAAAGGTAFTDASTGAFPFVNPTNPDTQHFVSGFPTASVAFNTLLLYDLLFGCAKIINSTGAEAVSGVPTRYQNQSMGDDYIGGNFLFIQVGGTAMAATAHNWTVCLYTDQAGVSSTLPSLTGASGAIVDRLDHPAQQWFAPLEAGDVGIKALTQMQCSALVATGVIWFMIGHPIAWMPCPAANMVCQAGGMSTAFNFARIFDDACLAFLECIKPSTTATTYGGTITTVAG